MTLTNVDFAIDKIGDFINQIVYSVFFDVILCKFDVDSERWDSNPLETAWKADDQPMTHVRINLAPQEGLEPSSHGFGDRHRCR